MTAHASSERAKLRRACFDLAAERGYLEVDREALVERAGLDQAAFARHYSDLEDCLLDAYHEAADGMLAAINEAVAAQPTWLEQMRALGPALIEFLREDEPRARYLTVEVVSGGDRMRVAREQDLAKVCELIDRGRYERPDPDSVPADTAMIVAGTMFLRAYQGMLEGRLDTAYEEMPEAMHSIVLPYLGEEAALAELHRPPPSPPERT